MPDVPVLLPRTPLYQALNSDRYARQEAICKIQRHTGRKLLVYETNVMLNTAALSLDDVQPFGDLLAPLIPGEPVDLLVHSPGGDVDAAEKIVYMCRHRRSGGLRAIVPEYAKSAATLMALASDEVVMGITSELGPIDAQVPTKGPGGQTIWVSAQSFLDEFETIKQEVAATGTLSAAYFPLLEGINIGFIGLCRNSMDRSKQFAMKWLKQHMLRIGEYEPMEEPDRDQLAAKIAESLCAVKTWLTHGAVIDADETKKLGIRVNYLEPEDPLWQMVWYLHCCYSVLFRTQGVTKIYESATVSLAFS